MVFFKRIFLWGFIAALIYGILSFHVVFFSWDDFSFLKKSKFTLRYTFFMAGGKSNKYIMSIDELRRDGIGEILVEAGRMNENEKRDLLDRHAEEDERYREQMSKK